MTVETVPANWAAVASRTLALVEALDTLSASDYLALSPSDAAAAAEGLARSLRRIARAHTLLVERVTAAEV